MKESAIIIDLDGTLCDLQEAPYIHAGNERFKEDIWKEIHSYRKGLKNPVFIILTGRSRSDWNEVTVDWLQKNGVVYDYLIMNMDGQPEENHIFKKKAIRVLMQIFDVQIVYDDNPNMISVCKKLKIPLRLVDSTYEMSTDM